MTDITQLILDDHETFRREFAALDHTGPPLEVRVDLGHQFLKFKTDHPDARDVDTADKDPQGYVSAS